MTSTTGAAQSSSVVSSGKVPSSQRRWRVFQAILFVVIVMGGALVVISHPVRYSSSGTAAIIGSQSVGQREARAGRSVDSRHESVLARFRDPTVVSDIFVRIYRSWTKQEALRAAGLVGELEVSGRTSVASATPDHGPIVVFTVISDNSEQALRGVELVVDDFYRELRIWQAGAFPSLSVSAALITAPSGGIPLGGSRPRAAVAVVVFAALATWLFGRLLHLVKAPLSDSRVVAVTGNPLPPGTSESERSGALVLLQTFVWLLALLPARLVFPQIGYFGSPASLVGLAAFGLWASGAVRPELLVRRVITLRVAFAVFWLPTLLSFAVLHLNPVATDELNSADRWLLFLMVWSGVALLAAEGLRSRQEVLRLLRVTVAAGAFGALVAIFQARLSFDYTTYAAKLPILSSDGELGSVLSRGGLNRPAGTASHPIEFGVMLCMVLGFALVLALHDEGWASRRRWFAMAAVGLAIPLAVSRSAILGGAIVFLFWAIGSTAAQRRLMALITAVGAVGVFMVQPGLIGTLTGYFVNAGSDSSITTRTSDYSAVASFIRRSPWVGRGPGTFLPKYRILDNTWLTFSIELGVLGVIGLLFYFGTSARLGLRIRRLSGDPLTRALGQAFIGLSALIIVESTTYDFFAFPMTPGFLAVLFGLSGALVAMEAHENGDSTHASAPSSSPVLLQSTA